MWFFKKPKTITFTFGYKEVSMVTAIHEATQIPCLILANEISHLSEEQIHKKLKDGYPRVILKFDSEYGLDCLLESLEEMRKSFKKPE
jgi:50S ribosomal subunit-associated GTPase HflX